MGENDLVINVVRDDHPVIDDLETELSKIPKSSDESERLQKQSIYRVPAHDPNEKAYRPEIVSIGPYHHGASTLKTMESHKHRALLHFRQRTKQPLERFFDHLEEVVGEIKDAYDQLDPKWDDTDEFLRVMILDGCFILELLRTSISTDQSTDYTTNDPYFSRHGKLYNVPHLRRDMLLLENQLPMLVLERLDSLQSQEGLEGLINRIVKFFTPNIDVKDPRVQINEKCLHMLDVHRKSLISRNHAAPPGPAPAPAPGKDRGWLHRLHRRSMRQGGEDIIRAATELREAGINIKPSKTRYLNDISFRRGPFSGVLKLPLVLIDDTFRSMYLNMITFERFHAGAGNEVTSYIFFMDNIIDNKNDVKLLHQCGIIQNALGSDKDVAKLFNSLFRDITFDAESGLYAVHKKVNAYCQNRAHSIRAQIVHHYLGSRWSVLAMLGIGLTVVQTVYAVLEWSRPWSS